MVSMNILIPSMFAWGELIRFECLSLPVLKHSARDSFLRGKVKP